MKKNHQTLWQWMCIRILTLAIGTVILIAFCMWLRFAVQYTWITQHMPPDVFREFLALRQHPETDLARFHEIVDTWWGVRFSDPSVSSSDWITVGILVLVTIPFIVYFGLRDARPLSKQFGHLKRAAEAVTMGQFGAQAERVDNAPAELVDFSQDFNAMTRQLALYEKELRESHVAMAHELRSPLTAAIGRLQGMLDGVFTTEPRQLQMVMNQLGYLSRLIDDLHMLSLADAGQLRMDFVPANLCELIQERVHGFSPIMDEAGVRAEFKYEKKTILHVDPLRVGQVLTILMENAVRYGRQGGTFRIDMRVEKEWCLIDFSDDGPGVPEEFLSTMFERFKRGETSRSRHSGGSGLGLSIAKAICVAHGGRISAHLPPQGGLLIRLHFPLSR
ncbi:sensor histidine kinase [Pantoea ananatis]|uniref:sensor histidine kinase n=1 Tax=Pantoea ananas TaxID=553 RepID=UPI000CF3B832|nr:ATP-binding protein [Pantoea ananatis]PQK94926.1 two-component sensor histidine kinase [Pantoea ananatis]PXV97482.1 signal transduction histidine kinase [Pantoea ananatis]